MTDEVTLDRLAAYRLEKDLSYVQLAEEMARAGYPVKARSLHFALTKTLKNGPLDRTSYKIAQFVARVVDRPVVRKSRKRPAAPPDTSRAGDGA